MDANTVIQLIGSLGFPIVACGALFWQNNTIMKSMREAVENNTQVMIRLESRLERSHDERDGD